MESGLRQMIAPLSRCVADFVVVDRRGAGGGDALSVAAPTAGMEASFGTHLWNVPMAAWFQKGLARRLCGGLAFKKTCTR